MKIRKGEEKDQMRWGALTAGKKKQQAETKGQINMQAAIINTDRN